MGGEATKSSFHIEALARGDDAAWRALLEEHGRVIYLAASRVGGARVDRDDVFQDTCVAAFRGISSLRDPARVGGWLYRIAYRCALHRVRTGSSILLAEDLSIDTSQFADSSLIADDIVDRLFDAERVRAGLTGIDERCQDLLNALFLNTSRPSYEEISTRLGLPVGAIGPTRARCLKKLAKLLES